MLIKHIRIDVLVLILLESRRQWFSDVQQGHIQRYKSTYIYSIVSLLTIYDNWYQMVLHFPFYKISTYPEHASACLRFRLRRLDETASITVFEKGPYNAFANCGLPYYVGGVIPQVTSGMECNG